MLFNEIYQNYYPKIFRLCMGYVNDEAQAKDLTQETFITVWQKLSTFRNESAIGTWIFRIASNNCLRSMEKTKRMPAGDLPVQLPDMPEPDREEKIQQLYRCIATLEETERIIIALVLEGLPQAEIAAVTGLSEVNTRVKVHRIKEKLLKKLQAHEQF